MPLPTTGYATATPDNPTAALTDFTLLVDLSTMPASWWAEVDTTDPTKGRAAIDSSEVELACDWIDFDDTGETGWLRVKWTGTLATSGTQTIRIYPPVAANASVSAGDTYGRYAAYDSSWTGYWPMHDGNDRTASGNNLTATGVSLGNATLIGGATDFELSSSHYCTHGNDSGGATAITMMSWFNAETITGTGANSQDIYSENYDANSFKLRQYIDGSKYCAQWRDGTPGTTATLTGGTTLSTGVAYHGAAVFDSAADSHASYLNGSLDGTSTTVVGALTVSHGGSFLGAQRAILRFFDGIIDEVQIHAAARSAEWIAQEYLQTNDQASFWSTWTWNAGGGPTESRKNNLLVGCWM